MNFEQALIELMTGLESCNMLEVVPVDTLGWWDARKLAESNAVESQKTEALKFLERKVDHLRSISSAE